MCYFQDLQNSFSEPKCLKFKLWTIPCTRIWPKKKLFHLYAQNCGSFDLSFLSDLQVACCNRFTHFYWIKNFLFVKITLLCKLPGLVTIPFWEKIPFQFLSQEPTHSKRVSLAGFVLAEHQMPTTSSPGAAQFEARICELLNEHPRHCILLLQIANTRQLNSLHSSARLLRFPSSSFLIRLHLFTICQDTRSPYRIAIALHCIPLHFLALHSLAIARIHLLSLALPRTLSPVTAGALRTGRQRQTGTGTRKHLQCSAKCVLKRIGLVQA